MRLTSVADEYDYTNGAYVQQVDVVYVNPRFVALAWPASHEIVIAGVDEYEAMQLTDESFDRVVRWMEEHE